jgi:soluble lytic murein transglycosylase-like protein
MRLFNSTTKQHREKAMKNCILAFLVLMLFGSTVSAETYESAKARQYKNAIKTVDGIAITKAVNTYCVKYNLDPTLVHAVILTESGYQKYAKSPCGATGVMQLMPNTFYSKGFKDIYSIDENVHAGIKHLAGLNAKYRGNIYLALSAYNAGGGYVDKFNGQVPPLTKNYVNKVLKHKEIIENI